MQIDSFLSTLASMVITIAALIVPETGVAQRLVSPGGLSGATSAPLFVSSDGRYVIGGEINSCGKGYRPYRWSAQTGIARIPSQSLGYPLQDYIPQVNGISGDGSTIVGGLVRSDVCLATLPFLWSPSRGWRLPSISFRFRVPTYSTLNGTGSIIAGSFLNPPDPSYGVFRMEGSHLDEFGDEGEKSVALSSDGKVLVGWRFNVRSNHAEVVLREFQDGLTDEYVFGPVRAGSSIYPRDISTDGKTIVGVDIASNGSKRAFRWRDLGGDLQNLGLPSGATSVEARGVSADGTIVVGVATLNDGSSSAVRWRQGQGWRYMTGYLSNQGISTAGWTLTAANDVSADGLVIVGEGSGPSGGAHGWVAEVVSDGGVSGAPVDILDPNPWAETYYSGPRLRGESYNARRAPENTVSFLPVALANARRIEGVAADGVTRIVLRWPVTGPGVARFRIQDENATATAVGTLGRLGQSPTTTDLTGVSAVQVNGSWFAFASYAPPLDFDRTVADNELFSRRVSIIADFNPDTGADIHSGGRLDLIRPPVLFLHGLKSDSSSWNLQLQEDPRFITYAADYSDTNAASFQTNIVQAEYGARQARANAHRRGYAATQVTVIGHSMGGILARLHAANRGYDYYRIDNLGQGDFYKIITLYTPHLGSPMACVFEEIAGTWSQELNRSIFTPGMCITCGAFSDLRPDSSEIQSLPGIAVPIHAIAGTGGNDTVQYARAVNRAVIALCPTTYLPLCKPINKLITLALTVFDVFLPLQHDLIVDEQSAYGGLSGPAIEEVGFQYDPPALEYPIGVHMGAGAQDFIGDNVLRPLLFESVLSPKFAPSIAQNHDVPVSPICGDAPLTPPAPATAGSLTLARTGGSTAYAGDTVSFTVSGSGGFVPTSGSLNSDSSGGAAINSFPATVSVQIPNDAPLGTQQFEAIGLDQVGRYAISAPVTLTVRTRATLEYLETRTPSLNLGCIGETRPLAVKGLYSDGVFRSLTRSGSGTTYQSSNPAVVSVSVDGVLTAVAEGEAQIGISNGHVSTSVEALVSRRWCAREFIRSVIPSSEVATDVVRQSGHVCPVPGGC